MRAGLYHRVSTTDQRPEAARDDLRLATQHRGYSIALDVEETGSGALNDRPGLQQLMTAAKKRQIDVIVVWKLDRFGRSALDILANVQVLRHHGVALLCCSQGMFISDQSDPMTNCMLQMMAAFAELERETIRVRLQDGRRAAAPAPSAAGTPPPPPAPAAPWMPLISYRLLAAALARHGLMHGLILAQARRPICSSRGAFVVQERFIVHEENPVVPFEGSFASNGFIMSPTPWLRHASTIGALAGRHRDCTGR